jgi:hypothetical protein
MAEKDHSWILRDCIGEPRCIAFGGLRVDDAIEAEAIVEFASRTPFERQAPAARNSQGA